MSNYTFKEIETRWQNYWKEHQTFKAVTPTKEAHNSLPKYYVLDMFPYPSGAGLHVGHPLGYIASDIVSRYKRHKGFNVLHPQGFDSFGLPAEQYAIQTGQHPAITTEENIKTYRRQLDLLGFSFDWSREIRTSKPDYYKWTQWIFSQLFNSWYNKDIDKAEPISHLIEQFAKNGNTRVNAACDENIDSFSEQQWHNFTKKQQEEILLKYRLTYLANTEVNWCPALGTVLANDEIVNGVSERGGHPVVRKKMTQWSMRISAYAERLLQGLETVDWTESLKETQRNWIGKSIGASVKFKVRLTENQNKNISKSPFIEVFTTRPDTLFGVSFMTLAPEHELVSEIITAEQKASVNAYIQETAKRSERERMTDIKRISGVFTGSYAEHPFTKQAIPIWIGDYVLANYGTGAVMAVPCGDQRDYDFAKHFNLKIPNIFDQDISEAAFSEKDNFKLVNSDFINGLSYKDATKRVIEALEEIKQGEGKINYRLRDAVFSRQRYWGEPFPIYYQEGLPQLIDKKHLPICLPEVEKYLPTETGEPPLGNAKKWYWLELEGKGTIVTKEDFENCSVEDKRGGPLELNTMPGWAGSSWYWLRYMDAQNPDAFASNEALDYWEDVDLYIGGSEHATGHLLYARFWNKVLKDLDFVPKDEPFKKLINQGMILGTSAIVYRISNTNTYVSKGLKDSYNVEEIRVDVNLVNASDEIDIEKLKAWQPQYQEADFILENDTYIVGREVEKMSKRWFNVVNPDEICEQFGADSLRLYEMFLGPLEQYKPWNTAGITGVHNFLKKLWKLFHTGKEGRFLVTNHTPVEQLGKELKILHKTIKKVENDIENFTFNTSVSTFMIAVNELSALKCNSQLVLEPLIILIAPYAPHIAEELWSKMGHPESLSKEPYPVFEEKYLVESSVTYPISFNGKMRFTIDLPTDIDKATIEQTVLNHEKTIAQLEGRTPKKVIVVPRKIVNIVS